MTTSILLSWVLIVPDGWCGKVWIGFGDSITQGYPYVTEPGNGRRLGGYEPSLEALIALFGGQPMVLNFGIGGESSTSGLNRIRGVITSTNADFILIMEGTNDVFAGISPETTLFNLNQMIEISRDAGLRPMIATLTPDERDGLDGVKQIPEKINPAIRELAEDQNIPLADQYAAVIDNWDDLVSDDGLHPNADGYQAIAEEWFRAMLRWRRP